MAQMDQLEEAHTNNNPTNPMLAFFLSGASASSQPPSPSPNDPSIPTIHSDHQSYPCSWILHNSGVHCDHVATDRAAFLRHLREKHHVSGDPGTTIICQLLNSSLGSACNTPIKRENFPRHVDTHYSVRYYCQYCLDGKSFSRQDSWKKHIRSKHQ
ncbi:hypothetical protein OG21DRAFT_131256 [Imleria badia]|nr:hypothetical protein OG21DRAFT_131256 [Imleria badia]